MGQVVIELLSTSHDRKGFDCGRDAQYSFLKERARKQAEIKYSITWVAVESNNPTILGSVTLSMGSVTFENISEDLRAKLPKISHAGASRRPAGN
ncbi:MAG TPA: hypothetical protein VK171_04685 [Fimbriimonas sp.]|nr:hypothetical protein [Fimbriimonas sp.]